MRVDDVAGIICQALGIGMGSIPQSPRADAEFVHLAQSEVRPGDLIECLGSDGKPVRLGKGGFGEVFKATLFGHRGFVAVKRVHADRACTQTERRETIVDFKKEMLTLFSLRSPYVVEAMGFSLRPDDMFLVMEFMPAGCLEVALHKPRDRDASWLRWPAAGKRVLEHVAAGKG
jgi:hypothetical protein